MLSGSWSVLEFEMIAVGMIIVVIAAIIIGLALDDRRSTKLQNELHAYADRIEQGQPGAEEELYRLYRLNSDDEAIIAPARLSRARIVVALAQCERLQRGDAPRYEQLRALQVYIEALATASNHSTLIREHYSLLLSEAKALLNTLSATEYDRLCCLAAHDDEEAFLDLWELIVDAFECLRYDSRVACYPAPWNEWLARYEERPLLEYYHPRLEAPEQVGALHHKAVQALRLTSASQAKEVLAWCDADAVLHDEVGETLIIQLTTLILAATPHRQRLAS